MTIFKTMFRLPLRFLLLFLPVLIQGSTKTWGSYDPSKLILFADFHTVLDSTWTVTFVDYKPPSPANDVCILIAKIIGYNF